MREADWHGGSLAASSRAGKAAVQLRVCHKFTGYFLNAGLCHLKRREPRRGGIFVEGRLPRSKPQRGVMTPRWSSVHFFGPLNYEYFASTRLIASVITHKLAAPLLGQISSPVSASDGFNGPQPGFGRHQRSGRAARVTDPVTRTWAVAGGPVARVREPASVQRQAAAADALSQPCPQALELGYPLVNPAGPTAREFGPVRAFRHPVQRQLGQLSTDLFQCQPKPLGEDNECDLPEHCPRIAPVARAGPVGLEQPSLLVKAEGRRRHATATRNLGDGQQVSHGKKISRLALDFKFT